MNRQKYYELLDRVRMHGDWETWLESFLSGVKETAQQAADTSREILTLIVKKDRREIEELGRPCWIGSAGSPTPLTQADHHNPRNSQTTPSFCAYCREGFAAHGEARHGFVSRHILMEWTLSLDDLGQHALQD